MAPLQMPSSISSLRFPSPPCLVVCALFYWNFFYKRLFVMICPVSLSHTSFFFFSFFFLFPHRRFLIEGYHSLFHLLLFCCDRPKNLDWLNYCVLLIKIFLMWLIKFYFLFLVLFVVWFCILYGWFIICFLVTKWLWICWNDLLFIMFDFWLGLRCFYGNQIGISPTTNRGK